AWSGRRIPGVALAAAGVGLLVHLLGAGGIEMPAITQTLLVLVAIGTATHTADGPSAASIRPAALVALGAVMLGLFAGCLVFGLKPVLVRDALVMAGDVHRLEDNTAEAQRLYAEAAAADPLSPEPLERQAGILLDEWWSESSRSRQARRTGEFERAMELFEQAARLDPHGPQPYRQLGRWWLMLAEGGAEFAGTKQRGDAATAARWLERAVRRYPSHAALRAEFARALRAAGRSDDARDQARIALRLDEINRRLGHTDRYLSNDDLARLRTWADQQAD
ncbi:MAG: tetratricopeptide repeat protein, partial [Planctomycetaceae bacterium]